MERGQASLEYVAVAGLVALVLAVGAAVSDASAIPRALASHVHRALCLVSGGDCLGPGGPRPCVVRARERASERRVKAWLARLGDGRAVLVEERSDGTAAVTVTDMGEAVGGPRLPKLLSARLGARLSAGRRWVVPDAEAARTLVAGLERDRLPGIDLGRELVGFLRGGGEGERFVRFGTRGEAAATLPRLGLGRVDAGLAEGLRVDGRSGRRTIELRSEGAAFAQLRTPLAGVTGHAARELAVEAELTREGEPLSLTLRLTGDVHGAIKGRGSGGGRVEADVRLDLTDPRARSLATAFFDRARDGDAEALDAAAALGRHLSRHARIDVRRYATTHGERRDGRLLGTVETVEASETAVLVDAAGYEPGIGWSPRFDCGMAR